MKKKRGLLFSIWLIVSVALGLLFWRGTDALAGELDVAENTNTGQQYETLAAAVSAASAGDTIKMIADHAVDSTVEIDRNLILDLNGKTVSESETKYTITVLHEKELTVKDSAGGSGKIRNSFLYGASVRSEGTLILESGILSGGNGYGLEVARNNEAKYGTAVLNGGTVHSDNYIAINSYGTLTVNEGVTVEGGVGAISTVRGFSPKTTVNGGKIFNQNTGGTGSVITAGGGTVTVNDGEIYGTHGLCVNGGTIVVPEGSGAVVKAVGSVSSRSALYTGEYGGTFKISGGWYSDAVDNAFVVDGYQPTGERPASERKDQAAPYTVSKIFKITYIIPKGLENSSDNPTEYGLDSIPLELLDAIVPDPDNGTFGGWYADAGYKNKITAIEDIKGGDLTLYAKLDPKPTPPPTPEPALDKPAVRTIANVPKKSMDITWKKVEGATGYKVSWRVKGGKWKSANTSKLKYTVKGMKLGKYYEFKVAAKNGDGTGRFSDVNKRWFRPIKRLKATGRKGAVRITWRKTNGAKGYIAYCSTNKNFTSYKSKVIKGGAKTSFTFKNLKRKQTYYVLVRPYKTLGKARWNGITNEPRKVKTK